MAISSLLVNGYDHQLRCLLFLSLGIRINYFIVSSNFLFFFSCNEYKLLLMVNRDEKKFIRFEIALNNFSLRECKGHCLFTQYRN